MKCPNCGQIDRRNGRVCALCGAPLKKKRRHGPLLALLLIIGMLLGGGAIYLLTQPASVLDPILGGGAAQTEREDREAPPLETALVTPSPAPLCEDGAEIFARDRYTLVLRRDGTVMLAGQSSSPEFGFDLFDWSGIVQLVPQDSWIAGLTADGRVRLTGEVDAYSQAAQWIGVERLLFDADTLFGLTREGRVLAAGPDLGFDPETLENIHRLIPGGTDTLAVGGDAKARVLPRLGMIWDVDGVQGVAQVEVNADYALYRMEDGTIRLSPNYEDYLAETGMADPFAGWRGVKELVLGEFCALGLTEDGRVLSAACEPDAAVPDTSDWSGVVQLVYDRQRNRALGLTEDGRVLQAVTDGEADPAIAGWEKVTLLRQNESCVAGLTADGRVLLAWEPGYAPVFEVEDWTEITDLALGYCHLVGLRADGTVLVTGNNSYGQCG